VVQVVFKRLSPDGKIPTYATVGAACFDLYAAESVELYSNKVVSVSLGFSVAIPEGYEMQIRSRSGMAKRGIIIANGIGTIDSDYRGEVKALLCSLAPNDATFFDIIRVGDRVAQGIVCPVLKTEFVEVSDLDVTLRGEGGFGSTGH
jgi:dUTP pyrophosphatase